MPVFSSTQPSLRARVITKFPAQVLAGNLMTITKSGGVYTFAVTSTITATRLHVPSLVNAANDGAAAGLGVAVGEVYRNGSALMVRTI